MADGLGESFLAMSVSPHSFVDKFSLRISLRSLLVPFADIFAAGGVEESGTLTTLTGFEDMSLSGVLASKFNSVHLVVTLLSVIGGKLDTIDGDTLGRLKRLDGQLRSVLDHETMSALGSLSELSARFVEVHIIRYISRDHLALLGESEPFASSSGLAVTSEHKGLVNLALGVEETGVSSLSFVDVLGAVEGSLADGKGLSLGHTAGLLVSRDHQETISADSCSLEVLLTELPVVKSLGRHGFEDDCLLAVLVDVEPLSGIVAFHSVVQRELSTLVGSVPQDDLGVSSLPSVDLDTSNLGTLDAGVSVFNSCGSLRGLGVLVDLECESTRVLDSSGLTLVLGVHKDLKRGSSPFLLSRVIVSPASRSLTTDKVVVEHHVFSHREDNTNSLGLASSSHRDFLDLGRVDVDLSVVGLSKEYVGAGEESGLGGSGDDETITTSVSFDGLGAVFTLVDIDLEVLDNSDLSSTRNDEFSLVLAGNGKRNLVGLSSSLDSHDSNGVSGTGTFLGKLHGSRVCSRGEGEVVDLDGFGCSVIKDTSEVVDLETVFASNVSGEAVDLASLSVPDTELLLVDSKVFLALSSPLVLSGLHCEPHTGVLSVHGVVVLHFTLLDSEYLHFLVSNLEFLPGRVAEFNTTNSYFGSRCELSFLALLGATATSETTTTSSEAERLRFWLRYICCGRYHNTDQKDGEDKFNHALN